MKQETAIAIMKSGHSVFLTGAAGTGKSYVIHKYIKYLRDHGIFPSIVAPTGIAASHIGGMTIHSCFGLGPFNGEPDESYLIKSLSKQGVRKRLEKMQVLIIDEVSMLAPSLFTTMDKLLRMAKEIDSHFGGVQLVLSGDFFQLPPVVRNAQRQYIWQTDLWEMLELHMCYLHKKYRQKDDALLALLEEIRRGEVSEDSMNHLRRRYRKSPDRKDLITKLYTHNADIDRINSQALEELEGEQFVYPVQTAGTQAKVTKIVSGSLMQEELQLKKDAVVMFIKNSPEGRFVNGTLGKVIGFSEDNWPLVETKNEVIEAEPMEWKEEDDKGKIVASVTQVPLRLAWAITVHKSQGMTLDAAEIDLSRTFEVGQGYVALSRLRSFADLKLMGLNMMALQSAPELLEEDIRMQTLSDHYEEVFESHTQEDVEAMVKNHIIQKKGYVEIRTSSFLDDVSSKQAKGTISKKVSPIELTRELVLKQLSVKEIATKRELKDNTILRHLLDIKEMYPETDFAYLRPESGILKDLEGAIFELKKRKKAEDFTERSTLRKKAIHDFLGGRITYYEINIAYLFIDESAI